MGNINQSLTIITPTYNRAAYLIKCYESLKNQTCFDFEWIVVDDGSTDDTLRIVGEICEQNNLFHIELIRKENGGKHTALNAAHPYINGKYVLILDSDDKLTSDCVQVVLDEWKFYEGQDNIGLLVFQKENEAHTVCAYARDERVPVDLLSYQRTTVLSSDCCEVLRSDLFLKYPFPAYPGEHFLAETALWYRAGLEKQCVYINKPIYVCEYLEGGLTQAGRSMRVRNPLGGIYTSYLRMNKRCRLKERIKAGLLYVCYSQYAKKKSREILKGSKPYQLLVLLCYLPGSAMYLWWQRKY